MTANLDRKHLRAADVAWMDEAICQGHNLDIFFGSERGPRGGKHKDTERAKTICAECPVRIACLDYALTFGATAYGMYGVYGGTTRLERHALLDERKSA